MFASCGRKVVRVCVCGRHRFLWISRGAILCRSSSPGVESHPDYDRSRSADRGKGQLCSFKKLWVWEEAWSKCFARDLEAFRTLCHKSKLMRLSSTCSKTETKKNRNVLTQTMLRQQRTGARGMCFLVLDQKWSNMYIDIGQGASMCKSLCRHKEKTTWHHPCPWRVMFQVEPEGVCLCRKQSLPQTLCHWYQYMMEIRSTR